MHGNCPNFGCKDALFVDMKVNPCKEEIMRILFPKTGSSQYQVQPPAIYDEAKSSEVVLSSSPVSLLDQDLDTQNQEVSDLQFNHDHFWEIIEGLTAVDGIKDLRTFISYASLLRVYLGKFIDAGIKECLQKKLVDAGEDDFSRSAISMLDLTKQLHSQLEPSKLRLETSIPIIGALCEELRSGWSMMVPFQRQLFHSEKDENHVSDESGGQCNVEETTSKAEECIKVKKPASEATVNPKPQGNSKLKKNIKCSGRKRK
ncbi:hypothetical protein HRI_002426500 [Hibiscus trionum]|uniref:Uncharacterized protein n=1 Tax=Hibiscus trionum TaxID=183268 RepID=A0A9W7M2U8_HIBTR|nr:hypothetical protein HRI_002426500 [Hibiscus trionum]